MARRFTVLLAALALGGLGILSGCGGGGKTRDSFSPQTHLFQVMTAQYGDPRTGHTMIANGAAALAAGGYDGAQYLNTVEVATIAAKGVMGAFAPAVETFATARADHCAVYYSGFMYIIGGSDGVVSLGDVQYAAINAVGTPGPFTLSGNALNTIRAAHGAFAYNDFLYVVGGDDGIGQLATVEYAAINGDGSIGAFTVSPNTLNTARSGHSLAFMEGFIYVLGGYDGALYLDSIEYAQINGDGSVGAFTTILRVLPSPRAEHISITHFRHIYIIGGYDGTFHLNEIFFTYPKDPNDLIDWIANTNPLLTPRSGHAGFMEDHVIYVGGGDNGGTPFTDLQYAPFIEVDP